MVFRLAQTFFDPEDSQTGFAEPGAGAQTSGDPSFVSQVEPSAVNYAPVRPTKGLLSWLFPDSARALQAGQPEPENALQHRTPGSMPNEMPIFGDWAFKFMPNFSRGSQAYVANTGQIMSNPIGAGNVVMQRPQASYGPSGDYEDGGIWWVPQSIQASIPLQGLISPTELQALIGPDNY